MNVLFLRSAKKFIQKCDDSLYLKIKNEIAILMTDPKQNPTLKSNLHPIRTHHFYFKRTQYRIAYRIEGDVIIILIASLENFYEELERKS